MLYCEHNGQTDAALMRGLNGPADVRWQRTGRIEDGIHLGHRLKTIKPRKKTGRVGNR
jgi:hypothetical protein